MTSPTILRDSAVFEKFASPFKEFGPAGTFYIADRVFRRVSSGVTVHFYELMAQPLADKPLLPPRLGKNVVVREIQRDDPAVGLMGLTDEVLAFRFNQSTVCLGAFKKGTFIGSMWFCIGPYEEDEVRCTFVPQPESSGVFDFGLEVLPQHRLGVGFVALWDGANRYLRDRGYRYSFSRVSRFNLTSRRVHERFGWFCLGRALFVKLKRFQFMVATVAPYLHFSVSTNTRPTIRLRA